MRIRLGLWVLNEQILSLFGQFRLLGGSRRVLYDLGILSEISEVSQWLLHLVSHTAVMKVESELFLYC